MSLVFFLFVLVLQNPNLEFVQLYLVPVISLLCMDCRLLNCFTLLSGYRLYFKEIQIQITIQIS